MFEPMVDSIFSESTDYQVREVNYTELPVTIGSSTNMDNYFKSPYAKRYIIEDSIPKVTSDGEPHEVMTLVAGVSGMLTAIVILGVLITLIGCKNKERQRSQNNPPPSPGASEIPEMDSKRSSILPLFTKSISVEDASPRLVSISVISNNLGKFNPAFIASEMSLDVKKGSEDVPLGSLQKF